MSNKAVVDVSLKTDMTLGGSLLHCVTGVTGVCVCVCENPHAHTSVLRCNHSHWLRANVAARARLNIKSREGLSLFSLLWKAIFIVFNYLGSIKSDPCSAPHRLNRCTNKDTRWSLNWARRIRAFSDLCPSCSPVCVCVCVCVCALVWTRSSMCTNMH